MPFSPHLRGFQKGGIKGDVKRGEVVGVGKGPEGKGCGNRRVRWWEESGPKRTRKTLNLVPSDLSTL